MTRARILFLCTGNSCRSQMAEGWARHLKKDMLDAYSAGTEPKGVDSRAVRAMAEVGVDISSYRSKSTRDLPDIEFDYVITLCDNARDTCPFFPAKTALIHHEFGDPPRLAATALNEEEIMNHYRRVRDEIKAYVVTLPGTLTKEE